MSVNEKVKSHNFYLIILVAKHTLSKEILHETKMVLQYSVLNSVRLGGSRLSYYGKKRKKSKKNK